MTATNDCYQCLINTCATLPCPANQYAVADTSNGCYPLRPNCKKCVNCPTCVTVCPSGTTPSGVDASNPCNGPTNRCLTCAPTGKVPPAPPLFCVKTCPAGSYLQNSDTGCSKCIPCNNCVTTCPSGSYQTGSDTSNPCYNTLNQCKICTPCITGAPSACLAPPLYCEDMLFTGKKIWTAPAACAGFSPAMCYGCRPP
jgi:hypothetical protein